MKENIKKISKATLAEQMYNDLQAQIINGDLKEGEKLPSENTLSEMYGVSRLTTRAALQKLSSIGLIDVRTGEGSFVKSLSFDNIMSQITHILSRADLSQYLPEFRVQIEIACARLALKRATAEEMKHFEELADNMEQLADGNIDDYIQSDYEFHQYLCHMSSNPLFEMVYSAIRGLFVTSIQGNVNYISEQKLNGLKESAAHHVELAQIFRTGDEEKIIQKLTYIIDYTNRNNDEEE